LLKGIDLTNNKKKEAFTNFDQLLNFHSIGLFWVHSFTHPLIHSLTICSVKCSFQHFKSASSRADFDSDIEMSD